MTELTQQYTISCETDYATWKETPMFCDCTVNIKDKEFKTQRALLYGVSKKCRELLTEDCHSLRFDGLDPHAFQLFLDFIYTKTIDVSMDNIGGLVQVFSVLGVQTLHDVCTEFLDQAATARSCFFLLQNLQGSLYYLTNFVKYAAGFIEKIAYETDFSFLKPDEFKLLLSRARFTSDYARDDIITKYLDGAGLPADALDEYVGVLANTEDEQLLRTNYSAVFMCSPPDQGLMRAMHDEITVGASGQLNGRDPNTVIEENPARHWFTESDGNAWLMVEFQELYVQPTHYAIWAHGGQSTPKNWCFQGSNDKQSWVVLSRHRDDPSLKEPFSTATWPIDTNGFFKYFRIIQTGNNWSGNRWLYIRKLEIWGVACSFDK